MANQKMTDFRKRNAKEAQLNFEKQQEELNAQNDRINQLFRLILGLTSRLLNNEKKLAAIIPVAKAADWRSAALAKISDRLEFLGDSSFPTEAQVNQVAEDLQVEYFNEESAEDDIARNLTSADDLQAEKGQFAVVTMQLYKNGVEIPEQKVVRSKMELGAHELFPELDGAILGMRVGEQKEFPLDIQGRTDTAKLTLLALRKLKPKEEQNEQSNSEVPANH